MAIDRSLVVKHIKSRKGTEDLLKSPDFVDLMHAKTIISQLGYQCVDRSLHADLRERLLAFIESIAANCVQVEALNSLPGDIVELCDERDNHPSVSDIAIAARVFYQYRTKGGLHIPMGIGGNFVGSIGDIETLFRQGWNEGVYERYVHQMKVEGIY